MDSCTGVMRGNSDSLYGDIVEKDPTGRYLRYEEVLGRGAFKTVYKAFDEVDGVEVAWNQMSVEDLMQSPDQLERLYFEGIKPASLGKVDNPEVKQFIEKCLVPASMRLPAVELLKDPFLSTENLMDQNHEPNRIPNFIPKLVDSPRPDCRPMNCESPMDIDSNSKKLSVGSVVKSASETSSFSSSELWQHTRNNEFRLRGEKDGDNTISLTLRIADPSGRIRNIHFAFYLDSDTAISIAREMVEQLDLSNEDTTAIAVLIDNLIVKLVPSWNVSSGALSTGANSSTGDSSILLNDEISLRCSWDSGLVKPTSNAIDMQHVLAQMADVEDQGNEVSSTSDISAEYGVRSASDADNFKPWESYSLDGCNKSPDGYCFNSDFKVYDHEHEENSCEGNFGESHMMINETTRSSAPSYIDYCSGLSKNFCLSSIHFLSVGENNRYDELKLELDAIETQYQQCCLELLRMREQAIENARRRWITKKKVAAA
ncbi:Protein kinase-like domain containing protein [Parasponia andersonii]|uniref:non-specific serine/threonine protein kinase n=1 Tax=Parasponia andersonii TaxID=3476 RepID=A0A2P5DJV0_PARAD|nr:Protein kinase-like domain containing protein [Parasponia andersonii]